MAALRQDRLAAPFAIDGPLNGTIFLEYVRQLLCPGLRCGDVIILDNLSSHKLTGVREAIEASGATPLYLPPYSPDSNPLDQAFAKLKALLREAAARTLPAVWNALRDCLLEISENDCSNFLKNAGYCM